MSATLMQGAPPAPGDQVTLENWRLRPWCTWAFHHVREIVPSAEVPAGTVTPLPAAPAADVPSIAFETPGGVETTVAQALEATDTDALVVLRGGRLVAQHYFGLYDGALPHILFSITKSVTALLAGIVIDRGEMDPDCLVTDVLPEVEGSAYDGATIRHVLDMTVSVDFSEDYLDIDGDYIRYRRAMLWNPPRADGAPEDLRTFLARMRRGETEHGEVYHYVSPNTDLLGWIVERATGRRYAELLSEAIWRPLGAERSADLTVDRLGAPRTAGGLCATARDLARLGEMVRNRGRAGARQVIPEWWIDDLATQGDREAYYRGDPQFARGGYRSQWYQTGPVPCAVCAIGIHGQWLWIDPESETVIAKLSSQHEPSDDSKDALTAATLRAIAAARI